MERAIQLTLSSVFAITLAACGETELDRADTAESLESRVFVFRGAENFPGPLTTGSWASGVTDPHVAMHFRLHAMSSAELDIDSELLPEAHSGTVRARRPETERQEGQVDITLQRQGVFSKEGRLLDAFAALQTSGDEPGFPLHTVLHYFDTVAHGFQGRTLRLERAEGEHLGWYQACLVEVRRSHAAPTDAPASGPNFRMGDLAVVDLKDFRERLSSMRIPGSDQVPLADVYFASNCTLGDLTATLQALADVEIVDVLLVLLKEGQPGPWFELLPDDER